MAFSFDDKDIDIAARTMLGEAGGEGYDGLAAVASVLMNRTTDGRWGSSIAETARQPQQFSTWNDGAGGNNGASGADPNSDAYKRAAQIAREVFSGQITDKTGGATHYFSPAGMDALVDGGSQANRTPNWLRQENERRGGENVTIGGHIFTGRANGYSADNSISTSVIEDDGSTTPIGDAMLSNRTAKALGNTARYNLFDNEIPQQQTDPNYDNMAGVGPLMQPPGNGGAAQTGDGMPPPILSMDGTPTSRPALQMAGVANGPAGSSGVLTPASPYRASMPDPMTAVRPPMESLVQPGRGLTGLPLPTPTNPPMLPQAGQPQIPPQSGLGMQPQQQQQPQIPPQSGLGMQPQQQQQPQIPPQSGLGMQPQQPAVAPVVAQAAPATQQAQGTSTPTTSSQPPGVGPQTDQPENSGGPFSFFRGIGREGWLTPDRQDTLLALGTGILSGNNWSEGLAAGGQNLMSLNDRRHQDELLQADYARSEADAARNQGYEMEQIAARSAADATTAAANNSYESPFSIVGRDKVTGQEVVTAGRFVNGEYLIPDGSGGWASPDATLAEWRPGGRSESQDVTTGAGGIPNATFIGEDGTPAFTFQRESEAKNFGYAVRAVGAINDLDNIMAVVGPEGMTSMASSLQRWASNNANTAITPAILNGLIDESGLQGAAATAGTLYLQAVLRADTGAAYTGAEISSYAGAFLPSANDTPLQLEEKTLGRNRELQRFAASTGAAAPYVIGLIDGTYELPGGYLNPAVDQSNGQSTQEVAPPPPASFSGDPLDWQFLTPEQRALWK